jgi:hypothetical protein
MTLKEKFKEEKIYINPYSLKLTTESAETFEKIANDYAIEVLLSYHNSLFFLELKEDEAKKILKHIKKQKGL